MKNVRVRVLGSEWESMLDGIWTSALEDARENVKVDVWKNVEVSVSRVVRNIEAAVQEEIFNH